MGTLKRSPIKKRSPAAKWDGRVAGVSLQEYRDRKWSVDACYAKIERRGPAFSIRRPLPSFLDLNKKTAAFATGDVIRSLNSTLPSIPAFTMGMQSFQPPQDKSPGPSEYQVSSTMDPRRHPSIPKNC